MCLFLEAKNFRTGIWDREMGLRVVTVTKSHYLAAHPGQGRATTYTMVIPAGTNLTPKTVTH